ncbi:MAG: hypothetical protein ACXW1P_10500, partial [Methylophilaceae bacterium]
MESMFLLLGIVALLSMIGGLISFFSWTGKNSMQDQLNKRITALESQLQALQDRLEGSPATSKVKAYSAAPPADIAETAASTQPMQADAEPELIISEQALTAQALAASPQ